MKLTQLSLRAYIVRFRRELSAILAAFTVLNLLNHVVPLHSAKVAIATRNIPAGTLLQVTDIELKSSLITWNGAINETKVATGKRATRDLMAGQPLSVADLGDPASYTVGERVAVAVPLPATDIQLVRVGDTIDLLATKNDEVSTVAVGAAVVSLNASADSKYFSSNSDSAIVLAVMPTEARGIAQARSGEFTVVLRSRI